MIVRDIFMGNFALVRVNFKRITGIIAAAVVLPLMLWNPTAASDSIDSIITEAYGRETASQCREYLVEDNIPQEEAAVVREALKLIIKAGYPESCSEGYLKLAGELAGDGIGLADLTNKIREGVAKGVEYHRLIHVLGKRTEALKEGKALVLQLKKEGVRFLDQQMSYVIFADYLLRGVKGSDLVSSVRGGSLKEYPALDNVIR